MQEVQVDEQAVAEMETAVTSKAKRKKNIIYTSKMDVQLVQRGSQNDYPQRGRIFNK